MCVKFDTLLGAKPTVALATEAAVPRQPAPQRVHGKRRSRHPCLALLLLMLGVFTDNHHAALALDDLAFLTNGFHRRPDFHNN